MSPVPLRPRPAPRPYPPRVADQLPPPAPTPTPLESAISSHLAAAQTQARLDSTGFCRSQGHNFIFVPAPIEEPTVALVCCRCGSLANLLYRHGEPERVLLTPPDFSVCEAHHDLQGEVMLEEVTAAAAQEQEPEPEKPADPEPQKPEEPKPGHPPGHQPDPHPGSRPQSPGGTPPTRKY